VTFAQAVRAPQPRRVRHRPRHRGASPSGPRHARQPGPRRAAPAAGAWEIRSFFAVTGVILAGFLLVLLYLAQATAVSAAGYEAQRLEARRDELRRQNALLVIESARLDSPGRVEAEAQRLGLVRAASIRVVPAETVAAAR
jgi:hypothetical protein